MCTDAVMSVIPGVFKTVGISGGCMLVIQSSVKVMDSEGKSGLGYWD